MTNSNKVPNRLINEKSPYLLQHAYNPVDWFPWSEEAFTKAQAEDKPVFLSIGYSTCHWCHVMERESFEDKEVAEVLNKDYISIKVDREERPDIDNIYMSFCQATTGQGGWPLNVFLTPDKKPFYSGTYFPKRSQYGRQGLIDILETIHNKWKNEKGKIEGSADEMVLMLNQMSEANQEELINEKIFHEAFECFDKSFDPIYGGFGSAPKFPTPHNLLFLLRYFKMYKNKKALFMVEKTLLQMYKGGIFDHMGFGFSRYSTDKKWLVPHFEKMLYDNALLIMAYAETYQETRNPIYKEITEKTIEYIMRDMTSLEGGFYSAEDADSEGVEGLFYVWTKEEVIEHLGEEDGILYCDFYNITEKGNFEEKNILNLINQDREVNEKIKSLSSKLFDIREKRIHPHKDDKILTSWNGLMIAALSIAGKVINKPLYLNYAKKAISFIEKCLIREDGRLLARYREGDVKYLAYLDDYAFLIWAYIELYQAVFEVKYLKKAIELMEQIILIFEDQETAGFFLYGNDSEQLIARPKEIYDGALPSGNSVAAYLLLRLSTITGNNEYKEKAEQLFQHFSQKINQSPMAYTMMLQAKMYSMVAIKEIVLAGKKSDQTINEMLHSIHAQFLPFSETILNEEEGELEGINDFIENQKRIDGKTTAYICENFSCMEPVIDLEKFKTVLLNESLNY